MAKFTPSVAALLPLVAAAAHGASLSRICTRSDHDPAPVVVSIDAARHTVEQNGLRIADSTRSERLPGLEYFVSVGDGVVSWGARNTRSGAPYYRYVLDASAEVLRYDADGVHAEKNCAPAESL